MAPLCHYIMNNQDLTQAVQSFREGSYIRKNSLYEAYTSWARLNGFGQFSMRTFGQQMSNRVDVEKRFDNHKAAIYRLKEPLDEPDTSHWDR